MPADVADVKKLLQVIPGVAQVLDQAEQQSIHLDHPRSGELVCLAEAGAWFTYYFWLDDSRAPDYARTVDIHRKPGYDPVELFLDLGLSVPKAQDRVDAGEEEDGVSDADAGDPAGRDAGEGVARVGGGQAGGGGAADDLGEASSCHATGCGNRGFRASAAASE